LPTTIPTLLWSPASKALTLSSYPPPTPTPSQHLIELHSTGLTRGELTWPEPNSCPHPIPGRDFAGIIVGSPPTPSPRPFRPGDRVYALTSFYRPGHARTYSVAETTELARMPATLDFHEAAAVPMSALSAWQGLFTKGGLTAEERSGENEGKSVLITGASGPVGLWALQLARWSGVRSVAVVRTGKEGLVSELGADEVVVYEEGGLREWGEGKVGVEVVFDCAGGKLLKEAWTVAKSGGKVVGIAEPPKDHCPTDGVKEDVKGEWFIVDQDGVMLEKITDLIDAGKVKPVVDSVWKLEEWGKAFDKVETGHPLGRVVVQV
ncbi:zinc-binding oxidoreductase, partial [Eremomyces bilateralis CBS 781.70]